MTPGSKVWRDIKKEDVKICTLSIEEWSSKQDVLIFEGSVILKYPKYLIKKIYTGMGQNSEMHNPCICLSGKFVLGHSI